MFQFKTTHPVSPTKVFFPLLLTIQTSRCFIYLSSHFTILLFFGMFLYLCLTSQKYCIVQRPKTVVVTSQIKAINLLSSSTLLWLIEVMDLCDLKFQETKLVKQRQSHSVRGWRLCIFCVFEEINVKSCCD